MTFTEAQAAFPGAQVNKYATGLQVTHADYTIKLIDGENLLTRENRVGFPGTLEELHAELFPRVEAIATPPEPEPPTVPAPSSMGVGTGGGVVLPSPGIYFGVPAREYHPWPGATGSSSLKDWDEKSDAQVLENIAKEVEGYEVDLGSVVHAMSEGDHRAYCVLDEKEFRERGGLVTFREQQAALKPLEDVSGAGGKEVIAERCRVHLPDRPLWCDESARIRSRGVVPLDEISHGHARKVWREIQSNSKAAAILRRSEGRREVSFTWKDPSGIIGKGRADALPLVGPNVVDLVDIKTVSDGKACDPDRIRYLARDRRWAFQMKWYTRGLELLGLTVRNWIIIVAHTQKPIMCEVVNLARETDDREFKANQRIELALERMTGHQSNPKRWHGWSADQHGRPQIVSI